MSTNQDGTVDASAQAPVPSTPWGLALGRGVADQPSPPTEAIPVPVGTPSPSSSPTPSPPTEAIPVPIEGDDGEIIPPVPPPDAGEVFPASSSSRLPTYLDAPEEPTSEAPTTTSGFQMLGSIAATNASLSASGAPTPLAGIPLHPVDTDAPELDSGEAFVPQFHWQQSVPADDAPGGDGIKQEPEELPMSPSNPEPAPVVSSPNSLESIAAPATPEEHYEPRVAAPTDPAPTEAAAPPPTVPPARSSSVPWWRSPIALVLYGLVVMGGLGYGAYLTFFAPEEIALPPSSVVTAPQSTAPAPLTDLPESDLIVALPATTLTHAMVAAEQVAPRDVPRLEVRTAEVWDVVYSDGTGQITLRIVRHFTEDEAVRAWDLFAADADPREPVTAGDTVVGERARLDTEEGPVVLWRNLTLILMASGEGDLDEFVRLYPY